MFWTKSLIARIVTYFLILSIASVILVSFVTLNLAQQAIRQSVFERLNAAATLKEGELTRWISDRRQDVLILAQSGEALAQAQKLTTLAQTDPEFSVAYAAISQIMTSVLANKSDLEEIFILTDIGGKIVFSTNREHEGDYRVSDTFFTQGRLDTYIQNVYPSPMTGKTAMTIATPLLGPDGQRLGVLAVHLNLNRLDQIILQRAGLGNTGETYLVDKFNSFISGVRTKEGQVITLAQSTGIDAALQGISGYGNYQNYANTPVLGVYRWLKDQELALIAEIEEQEAYRPAQTLAQTILIVGLASVVVLAAGAVLVARQIARPVFAITNIARRVAAGDFSGAAPVLTQDEIGTLARTFNQMTEQLQSLYMGLEEKVAERTRELERRAVQLQAAAEVGSAVATVRNLDDLLSQVTRLIADRFGFYHVGIFLLDEKREFAVLRAANSEGGQRMLKRGHKLGIGQKGIVGFATGARQPRIAMDVGQDAVFFDNPDLPATRSEMALPLVAAGELLGALDVQSTQEAAFSTEDITTLQVLANQVAVAIENANLFAQNQAALAEIQAALETSRRAYGEVSHQAWENILRARPELGYRCTAEEHVEAAIGTWQAEMLQAQQRAQTIQVDDQTLIIPVKIRDNVAGAVKLRKTGQAGAWREEERQLIVNLVDQMGVALESSRLYDNAQRTAERERLTSEITARMRASLDIEAVLQTAARELGQALNAALEIHLGTDYRAQAEVSPAVPDNGHQGT